MAVNMLSPKIRADIYNIYGFVRFADEIVDTFHDFDKEQLMSHFENDYYFATKNKISLNPILHSFQQTVNKYNIPDEMVQAFLKSMKADLHKTDYKTKEEYDEYIFGSADVVGLMCLKVFVNGDDTQFLELKDAAMRLGSAFQKVNFLRDMQSDFEERGRTYFPGVDFIQFSEHDKKQIEKDIDNDRFDISEYEEDEIAFIESLMVDDKIMYDEYATYLYDKIESNDLPEDPSNYPSWFYFDYRGIVKNQWLIHFTDDAEGVTKDGFIYGVNQIIVLNRI
jgi:hypothetical protein